MRILFIDEDFGGLDPERLARAALALGRYTSLKIHVDRGLLTH